MRQVLLTIGIGILLSLILRQQQQGGKASSRSPAGYSRMKDRLQDLDSGLAEVLSCVADTVASIADVLHEASADDMAGSTNAFGDNQLQVDVHVDQMIFERMRACPAVEAASSEEQPDMIKMPGQGYTVVFDPLDGSSIVGANFAVGSIFGIWPGSGVEGRTGREMVASAYAVYGPKTLLVWARPRGGEQGGLVVEQYKLGPERTWKLIQPHASPEPLIRPTSTVFAPANLRSAADNKAYSQLVDAWIKKAFTLRYTGGMVPDVHYIIAKRGGVFVNPSSSAAPAKLRLVYECAPLAMIIEAAGGASSDGRGSILDQKIKSTSDRTIICVGSSELVAESQAAMEASL